jgi:hypothetical protein
MRAINRQCRLAVYLLSLFLMAACTGETPSSPSSVTTHSYKVAVIMEEGEQVRWERTAQWALENIAEAQRGLKDIVELQLTFKSQDDADIDEYIQRVVRDSEIAAIVGPTTSACASKMALALSKEKVNDKPMITPSCTNVEYQRKYAGVPNVWNMAESDIAQLEVMLSGVASIYLSDRYPPELRPMMLLCADDGDGDARNAYAEWFGFIAEEYGLKVEDIYLYKDETDLRRYVRQMCGIDDPGLGDKGLLFNPSNTEMALAFDDEVGKMYKELRVPGTVFFTPQIYCSDAFVSEQTALKATNATYQGVDLYASPESGFNQAYHQRFGEELINGEAQFYDGLCLVAYAAALSLQKGVNLNEAILSVVDGRDGKGGSWLPADMSHNFELLSQGYTPDIDGVSGSWTFDEKTHSSVCGSTFRRWRLYDGQFLTTEYLSTEGSRRTTSSKNMWDWTASRFQAFSPEDGGTLSYPPLDDRWALLIAASKGWANYRFQADVFAMYQLLKKYGYDDDHIVLICEDDVARHANNPHQGELRISDTGVNVYDAAAIDYRLNTLSTNDIANILQGRSSERLPKVLSPDTDDNVLVFWSGHGSPGSLDFGGSQSMTYERLQSILDNTPHRKLLMAVEACYSGGLGEACEGLPGCLLITAANPCETSHADVWSEEVGVFLSNGFTRGFQESIGSNPDISLRDMYYTLARNTSGSHVKVYNVSNYGNVYSNTMSEYLK